MFESNRKPLYVALSGGVDSAVAAALLVQAGYPVVGVYMKNWADNFGISADCPWEKDLEDVKAIAEHLGIPWKVYNFEREYKARILDYFFAEYKAGRTPNPDILCNNLVKFDLFAQRAFSEGASHIVTGHYARRQSDESFSWEKKGDLGLYTAVDSTKDQVYFLQRLSQEQLRRALFPLGNYYKKEVRVLAKHFKLPNAEKKDSQGICFIGDIDVRDFIREHLATKPGSIVDYDTNRIVGTHQGLWFYTIGQRQGIEVSSSGLPYYVVSKDMKSNTLYVGKGRKHVLLDRKSIALQQVALISGQKPTKDVGVSIRYRETPKKAILTEIGQDNFKATVVEEDSFWAPAAGQGALLYAGSDITKIPEKRGLIDNSSELLKVFTHSETIIDIRAAKVLGGGIICE